MARGRSFHSSLLQGMVALAAGAIILLAAAALWFTHSLTRGFAVNRVHNTLDRVQYHVEQLTREAVRMNELARRRLNSEQSLPEQFTPLMAEMVDLFELNSELSYLGVGAEASGDYCMLQRISGSADIGNRQYRRSAEEGPKIADYRFHGGVQTFVRSMPWDGYDPRQRPFYLAAKGAGRPVWTDSYVFWRANARGPVPGITYAAPLLDAKGNLRGVLDVDFDLLDLSAFLRHLASSSEGYSFIIEEKMDGSRGLVAHPDSTQVIDPVTRLMATNVQAIRDPVVRAALELGPGAAETRNDEPPRPRFLQAAGERYFWAERRLTGSERPRWTVVTVLPGAIIDRETRWIFFWLGSAALLLLGLSVALAGRMARHVAEPLRQLEHQLVQQPLETGPRPVSVRGPPEFMRLAEAFNRLVDGLNRHQSELVESNRALQSQIEQRQQAEATLREYRDRLEELVRERTSELSRINLVLASQVHERNRVEAELREANERLKELDRLKSEFLATMSHELRTPLNSIIGFTGILRQRLAGPLTAEQDKQISMVQGSARHLLGLINDLLDLSRLESGKMELHYTRFRAAEVIQEVVKTLEPLAGLKQLPLRVELLEPELELESDRKKIFQILLNLANNAVKFTEKGEVRLRVERVAAGVQFTVLDTGIGIKPAHLVLLFEAFRQVDGSARRVYEGTGLGLYLCRKLTGLLGGEIAAKSEFGKGSEFCFTLPVNRGTQLHV